MTGRTTRRIGRCVAVVRGRSLHGDPQDMPGISWGSLEHGRPTRGFVCLGDILPHPLDIYTPLLCGCQSQLRSGLGRRFPPLCLRPRAGQPFVARPNPVPNRRFAGHQRARPCRDAKRNFAHHRRWPLPHRISLAIACWALVRHPLRAPKFGMVNCNSAPSLASHRRDPLGRGVGCLYHPSTGWVVWAWPLPRHAWHVCLQGIDTGTSASSTATVTSRQCSARQLNR